MSRSRTLSIFLLKAGVCGDEALRDDHALESTDTFPGAPDGAQIFILDGAPRPPWWRDYFSITEHLEQSIKGALLFLPVKDRVFALSFGHVSYKLREESYEHDFGLRVTLNAVERKKLRSTDTLDPGASRRRRTQHPVDTDLTLFDLDRDSTVLKTLTGKVKDKYSSIFRNATGSTNLRISTKSAAHELVKLCESLLDLYHKTDYKDTFKDLQCISPVKDPSIVADLNQALIAQIRSEPKEIQLTTPELIDYNQNMYTSFSGVGPSLIYEDTDISHYLEYLKQNQIDVADLSMTDLKSHTLSLANEDGTTFQSWSVYKSLIFDCALGATGLVYHLSEGNWYAVEPDFLNQLDRYLDQRWCTLSLPAYKSKNEGDYNDSVSIADRSYINLDRTNISPSGSTQVEPCDLLRSESDTATFYHVKISTLSHQMSHLFNQGSNSMELLRAEPASLENLKKLISDRTSPPYRDQLLNALDSRRCKVVYAIITDKDENNKSRNLPLFSRVSLRRNLRAIQVMGVESAFGYVADESTKSSGKRKPRKPRSAPTNRDYAD